MTEYIEREAVIDVISNTDWYSINKDGRLIMGASDGDTALFKQEMFLMFFIMLLRLMWLRL